MERAIRALSLNQGFCAKFQEAQKGEQRNWKSCTYTRREF